MGDIYTNFFLYLKFNVNGFFYFYFFYFFPPKFGNPLSTPPVDRGFKNPTRMA